MAHCSYCYTFYFHDLALFQALDQRIALASPGFEVQALGLDAALNANETLQDFKLTPTYLHLIVISKGFAKANLNLIRAAGKLASEFVRIEQMVVDGEQTLKAKRHYYYQAKLVTGQELERLLARYEPQARLFKIFEQHDLIALQAALDAGLDVNTQIDHKTLLWLAYEYASLPMFITLLAKGANTNSLDVHGRSLIECIILEARSDSLPYCQSLVQHGIDLHQCFADGGSLLWHSWVYNKPLAQLLIELNAPYIRAFGAYQNQDTLSSLQTAIVHNDVNKITRFMARVETDHYHFAQIAKTCCQVDHLPVFEQIQNQGFNAFANLALAEELLLLAADAHALDILSELFSQAQIFKFCFAAVADDLMLSIANLQGAEPLVQLLLDQGANVDDNHALVLALQSHELQIARLLIAAGMPLNLDASGEPCSLLADYLPILSTQAVRLLLDSGAEPLLAGRQKASALEQALASKSIASDVAEVFTRLLEELALEEAIWIVLGANNLTLFQRFWRGLSEAERLDCLNAKKQNLLIGACDAMALNIAQFLIEQRCFNLACKDAQGNHALAYAILNSQELLVQWLIDAGAKVNTVLSPREPQAFADNGNKGVNNSSNNSDRDNEQAQQQLERGTPKSLRHYVLLSEKIHHKLEPNVVPCPLLLWASANSQLAICQLLVDAGAELECTDRDGHGVLFFSLAHGDESLFEFFLSQGCDYQRLDLQGYNLIHTAVLRQQPKLLNRLLALGVDVNAIAGSQGLTALMLAAQLGLHQQEDMVQYLLEADVAIETRNQAAQSALILASEVGNQAALVHLLKAGAQTDVLDTFGFSAYDYFLGHQQAPQGFRLDQLRPDIGRMLLAKSLRAIKHITLWHLLPSLVLATVILLIWPKYYLWVINGLVCWYGVVLLQRPLHSLTRRYLGLKYLPDKQYFTRKLSAYFKKAPLRGGEFSVKIKL